MAFYVGCYLIDQDTLYPLHTGAWQMPEAPTQHMAETSNVEELHIVPTRMDSIPTQIQYGCTLWTDDEGFTADYDYNTFYVKNEAFYVRGFSASTGNYSEFYVRDEAFYVRGWSSGDALYDTFYVRDEAFYVRGWTSGDALYDTFYVRDEEFYVRGFTPVDFFYTTAWSNC